MHDIIPIPYNFRNTIKLYTCPICEKPGLPSAHPDYPMCTNCANLLRGFGGIVSGDILTRLEKWRRDNA